MFRKLKRPWKILILCISFLVFVGVSYTISRIVALNNNDFLLHYEEYKPVMTYNDDKSGLTIYEYALEDGIVAHQVSEHTDIIYKVVFDKRRGVVKQYYGNVLQMMWDNRTAESSKKIFGVVYEGLVYNRPVEECEQLNKLLESEDYESITNIWKEQVIITTSGTAFVP